MPWERRPDFIITSIPVGDEISNLSAILMDEEYYNQTVENSKIENGIRIANPLSLLCLKIKAFLDLTEERKTNPAIRSSDIKKHRDDVFKLLAMRIDPFTPVELSPAMKDNIGNLIRLIESSLPNKSLQDSLQRTNADIRGYLDIMKGYCLFSIYILSLHFQNKKNTSYGLSQMQKK
jgi:hypothetical protein